jgi:hypothetical protein
MWRPISVVTNLGYDIFVLLIFYNNKKYKLTFRDFREENISIKSVHSISVLWRPRGERPGRPTLNPAQVKSVIKSRQFMPLTRRTSLCNIRA